MTALPDANQERRFELLADRATQGLSLAEHDELTELGGRDDTSFDFAATALDLGLTLSEVEPMPAPVRARVDVAAVAWLARTKGLRIVSGDEATTEVPRDADPAVVTRPVARPSRLPWLAAAAGLALAAAAWWPTSTPSLGTQRDALLSEAGTTLVAWNDPAHLGVTGDVVWNNRTKTGFLHFKGLAANDPTRMQYQLWIFDAARKAYSDAIAVDGGVFDVSEDGGEVFIPIDAKLVVTQPALFAVTTEPPGGVVEHATDEEKGYRIILTAEPNA